ncbi:MAG: hypothetical protein U0T69_04880 [Chitinophagales bacterium]
MQRLISFLLAFLLVSLFSKDMLAFHPKDGYKDGELVLKSGLVLKGKVLPLASYNESGTAFKNEQGTTSTFSHHQIAKIKYGDQFLFPKTIDKQGKNIAAYAELIQEGSASLWKTYFYDEKGLGKNTSAVKFDSGWLIYSPTSGSVYLNSFPSIKQVSIALHHPEISIQSSKKIQLDEMELRNIITSFNSSITQLESYKNDNSK